MSVNTGPTAGGTRVTATGTDFLPGALVSLGSFPVADIVVNSSTSISFTTPAYSASSPSVLIRNAGGLPASSDFHFTFVAQPSITSISPTQGPAGTSVVITGANLSDVTAVEFGGTPAARFSIDSNTQITAVAPSGIDGGIHRVVKVISVGGVSPEMHDFGFQDPPPTLSSLSPTGGPMAGGTRVTARGTGFVSGATSITIGGVTIPAGSVTVDSATSLSFVTPSHALGRVDVTATTVDGTSDPVPNGFDYVGPPVVNAISPASGPLAGGTSVVITGGGFSQVSAGTGAVKFGGVAASYTIDSGTQITAIAPPGNAGTVHITVATDLGGDSVTSSADAFTYVGAPTIDTLSPNRGGIAGGTVVTASGTSLAGATVTVDGLPATLVGNPTATAVTFVVPAHAAGDVTVVVTTPAGTASTTFTYFAPLTITPVAGVLPAAVVGTYYSQDFTVSGGTPPYTISWIGGTFGLHGSGFTVRGVPDEAGVFMFIADVRTSSGQINVEFQIKVLSAAQTISFGPLSNASLSVSPLTLSATASSGLAVAFTSTTQGVCTVSGTTLTLLTTGACTINADQAGDADNARAATVTQSFTVTTAFLTVNAGAASSAKVGVAYSQANTATGGVGPYMYAIDTGSLPPGVTLNTATGVVSGTPTGAGRFIYQIRANDSQATPVLATGPFIDVTIAKGDQALAFTSTAPSATVGDAAYTVSATPTSGLAVSYSLDAASTGCALAGTSVTFTGVGTCKINADQAGDGNWNAATRVQQSFAVAAASLVGSIDPASGAKVGASFSQALIISGGVTPYAFVGGNLIPGTTLDAATGVVTGTPTQAGGFQYDVVVTDSLGATITVRPVVSIAKGDQALTFTSSAPPASVGGAAYAVSASATSGLAVSYALDAASTGCALSGTNVTFNATGTCRINADQAGNSDWNAATRVQQSFAVGPAGAVGVAISFTPGTLAMGATGALTITFDNPNIRDTPAFDVTLTAPAVLTRVAGAAGGTCTTGSLSSGGAGVVNLSGIVVPSGHCTVTLAYAGAVAGASSGFTLGAFTPAGYLTTLSATSVGVAVSPTLTGVSPNAGPAGHGVTLSGTGFSTTPGDNIVRFGGAAATVTGASATSLSVTTPASGTGTAAITVTVNGQASTGAVSYLFIDKPVAADRSGVAVPYDSAVAIDLSGAITGGAHDVLGIGRAPASGRVVFSGDVATYTPAAGFHGSDSFTYTASGGGGVSNVATVTLVVAAPPAPVASDKGGVNAPYGGVVTIDLSGAITGERSGVTITRPPTHGVVTVAGYVVSYTPDPSYYGDDSFTYAATGPGGASNSATVSLSIGAPSAPTADGKTNIDVTYDSTGVRIDLASLITGVHSGIEIVKGPDHGVVTINGAVATYTPTAGYYGPDGFTYTATGPGGASAPASVSLVVATPAAPAASSAPVDGGSVNAGSNLPIDLTTLVTGVYDSIEISTPPEHGTVTLSGAANAVSRSSRMAAIPQPFFMATYTPEAGFAGVDSFAFVAVGPGGVSSPARVTITVVGQVPTAPPARTATTGDGQKVSVMLTDGAAGGPFVAATVVGVSPADAATTAIVASGSGPTAAYRLDVTPSNRFGGEIVVAYTLSNAYGASAPSTVTLTVQARPDPRTDPDIGAISDAQAETTRRFARAQVSNFMRRNEQLHGGGGRTGLAMGLTLSAPYAPNLERPSDKVWDQAMAERMRVQGQDPLGVRPGGASDAQPDPLAGAADGGDGKRLIGSVASWVGGAIDIGTRDAIADRSKVTARTSGLSGGADIKLRENLLVGLGGGFGDDRNRIGEAKAHVRGKSAILAAYASFQPTQSGFVDAMVGRGQLDFTTRRFSTTANATAEGKRDGDYNVAALSLGFERERGPLRWSFYGRGEYLDASLDGYMETGADRYNLRFDARKVESLTGSIGGVINYRRKVGFGAVTPHLRAEWSHEFADIDAQWLDYADIPGAAIYSLQGSGWKREQIQIDLGARFDIIRSGWSVDLETGIRAAQGEKASSLRIKLSNAF